MLTRYRWYRVQLPGADFDLARVMATKPLTADASFGFLQMEIDGDTPKYRFFWRTSIVVTRLDDDGNPTFEKIASINFTDFTIIVIDGSTFLRIENPGRNLRDLMNAFEFLVGLGFTSKPLTFEQARPTTVFENVDAAKLIGLKVVGAVVDEDLVARMEFASKQGMAVESVKLLDGMRYKVDSAVYELIFEGVRGQLAFTASGVAKVSGQLAPRLVHLIERDLPKLI